MNDKSSNSQLQHLFKISFEKNNCTVKFFKALSHGLAICHWGAMVTRLLPIKGEMAGFDITWLNNFLQCNGFFKNINFQVILRFKKKRCVQKSFSVFFNFSSFIISSFLSLYIYVFICIFLFLCVLHRRDPQITHGNLIQI